MCGIIGYIGKKAAAPTIYGGLLRLEYRGYDSAGIAVSDGRKVRQVKLAGRVNLLEGRLSALCGNAGIGHTRWATHGAPDDVNAHPHRAGKITIVHNGIIENYAELKREALALGETFLSETDSEVIACLINRYYRGEILPALKEACGRLRGSYAILAICEGEDGIAVAKNKSPVVIGCGADGTYVSSDIPALAGLCGEVCIAEDGDYAFLTAEGFEIYDGALNRVSRPMQKNRALPEDVDKGGYPHFMLKEIYRSPRAAEDTVRAFGGVKQKFCKYAEGTGRIILAGCGTAYNSCLAARRYFESFARVPCEVETAGEYRYKNPVITPSTLVIAVSQSGETADTVEAAALARGRGAKVIAVTNAPFSALTRIAGLTVPVAAGFEVCVAATKSYTGQLAALYLMAKALGGGDPSPLEEAPSKIKAALDDMDICAVADMCVHSRGVYFLGRDLDYATALEASLKLKEVSYIQCEGYAAGELKHGALALIDGEKTAVTIISDPALAGKCENAVEQVISRGGKVAVITTLAQVASAFGGRAEVVLLPQCDKYVAPLVTAAAVQVLAYRCAVLLGRNPDMPRNLAKSVTVE